MQAGQNFCLVFSLIVFQATPTMATTLKICSFSGINCSPDCDVRAGKDLYRRYAGFLPASKGSVAMLSQSKHWSSGCRVCRTCSAALGKEQIKCDLLHIFETLPVL